MKRSKKKVGTAFHEAGHAVIHHVVGLSIHKVTIRKDGDALGSVIHPSPNHYDAEERSSVARDIIISAYAGMIAEMLYDPNAPAYHGGADEEQAFDIPRTFGVRIRGCHIVGDEAYMRYLESRRVDARRLVEHHWSAIEALAGELLKRDTMSGEEVSAFLNALPKQ